MSQVAAAAKATGDLLLVAEAASCWAFFTMQEFGFGVATWTCDDETPLSFGVFGRSQIGVVLLL